MRPQSISHYRLIEELGRGGMGVVYRAVDERLDRLVAIKFLPKVLETDPTALKRFQREARAASRLNHPSICTIFDVGSSEGRPYLVMEFLEGENLRERMQRGKLSPPEILTLLHHVAEGLAAAHGEGLVHRDIKPSNLFLTPDGRTKILDFGLVKLMKPDLLSRTAGEEAPTESFLTDEGILLGTVAYMSPEQVRGEEVDGRSDLFSLGVVAYEGLSGAHPFEGDTPFLRMNAILHEDPLPLLQRDPELDPLLAEAVEKALQKNPSDRFQEATELVESLPSHTGTGAALGKDRRPPGSIRSRLPRFAVRAVTLLALVLFLVLLLAPSGREWIRDQFGFNEQITRAHLAILPFTAIGQRENREEFCLGLFENLTSRMTALEHLSDRVWVVPASEIRREEVESVEQARRAFGITLALTGSIQFDGEQIRANFNLVDAESLRQIRSEVLDTKESGLAALQDRATRIVAELIQLEVEPETLGVLAAGQTEAPRAVDFHLQGRGYLQRRDQGENLDLAIALFERALREDPRYAEAHASLGEAYWRKWQRTREPAWIELAVQQTERALALAEIPEARINLGRIYTGQGKYDDAIRQFDLAIARQFKSAEAHMELAAALEGAGEIQRAEEAYQRAIQLKPGYWDGYIQLGGFYFFQGEYEEAAEAFRKVIELTPDNVQGYNNLGAVFFYQQNFEAAAEMWQRSIQTEPNPLALSNLASLYFFEERHFAEAAELYEEAIALSPRDYRLRGNLAACYDLLPGRESEARSAFREAAKLARNQLEINPEDPMVLADLAVYESELGRRESALALAAEAIREAPDDLEVMATVARTYESLGLRAEALQWIEKALDQGYSLARLERSPSLDDLRKDSRFRELPGVRKQEETTP